MSHISWEDNTPAIFGLTERGTKHPTRKQSATEFKAATLAVASRAMRLELSSLASGIHDHQKRTVFEAEMQSFFALFNRYLIDRAKGHNIEWSKIQPLAPGQVISHAELPKCDDPSLLNKLAVLELNGTLGTRIRTSTSKALLEARDGMSFLDLSVRQIEHLNERYGVNVPFLLMNSFNTDAETTRAISKPAEHKIELRTFVQ